MHLLKVPKKILNLIFRTVWEPCHINSWHVNSVIVPWFGWKPDLWYCSQCGLLVVVKVMFICVILWVKIQWQKILK